MFEVTDESFERDVLRSDTPVVVEFSAPWCGPCKAAHKHLEELERTHAHVAFGKLDIDAHPVTAGRYGVLSLPTAILFADGEARQAVAGARSRSYYEKAWAQWLTSNPAPRT
jgi:thioredoxin 1